MTMPIGMGSVLFIADKPIMLDNDRRAVSACIARHKACATAQPLEHLIPRHQRQRSAVAV